MFPSKPEFTPVTSIRARQKLFGTFDFIAAPVKGNKENISIKGSWARDNIVAVEVPQLVGIAGVGPKGVVQCHRLAADSLRFVMYDLEQLGLLDNIHTWDGMFCPRFQRGSNSNLSNHAWGTALDINATWNGLGKKPADETQLGCVYDLVAIFNKHGWYWGGHFTRQDGMHFELTRIS